MSRSLSLSPTLISWRAVLIFDSMACKRAQDDPNFGEGSSFSICDDFNIAVYGGGSETDRCSFTITASAVRPLSKDETMYAARYAMLLH